MEPGQEPQGLCLYEKAPSPLSVAEHQEQQAGCTVSWPLREACWVPGHARKPGFELAGSRGALVGATSQAGPINDCP